MSDVATLRRDDAKADQSLEVTRALQEEYYRLQLPGLWYAKYHHVNTRGERFVFDDRPFLQQLYREMRFAEQMVVMKCVQVGISEMLICQMRHEAGDLGLIVMYVLPKYELRNRFVTNRIVRTHTMVPRYRYLIEQAETKVSRLSLMNFGRGSMVFVSSNVESEFVEASVDSAYVDELDRCNQKNLLLLPDRMSASPHQYLRRVSNPTVEDFGIAEAYEQSSKAAWHVRCGGCGHRFVLDFFRHVVRQDDAGRYHPIREDCLPVCDKCGKLVDRLQVGEWVHANSSSRVKGYHVSKLTAPDQRVDRPRMPELVDKWQKAQGNQLKVQVFYNSDLGLPYSSKGSRITRELVLGCREAYAWPAVAIAGKPRIIGVDVGSVLHYVVREVVSAGAAVKLRLLEAGVVPDFPALVRVLRKWRPNAGVIDANPEIHKVLDLKTDFHWLWSCRFQRDAIRMVLNQTDRTMAIDRTALLDYVHAAFQNRELVVPMTVDTLDDGEYIKQVTASVRVLERSDDDEEAVVDDVIAKARFVWRSGKADHYFLAEAYAYGAVLMRPDLGIFDWYAKEAAHLGAEEARRRGLEVPKGASAKDVVPKLHRDLRSPSQVLQGLQNKYAKVTRPPPVLEEVRKKADEVRAAAGYVDEVFFASVIQEDTAVTVDLLRRCGYRESAIKGQWVL